MPPAPASPALTGDAHVRIVSGAPPSFALLAPLGSFGGLALRSSVRIKHQPSVRACVASKASEEHATSSGFAGAHRRRARSNRVGRPTLLRSPRAARELRRVSPP